MWRLAVVFLIVATMAVVSGCATVCPAIGYSSVAHIELAEPRPDIQLELCDGADCIPGPAQSPTQAGATELPISTGVFTLEGDSVDGWSATLFGGDPELGYRLTHADGSVIAEGSVEVDWVRVDGTEQCGGNRAAEIRLPA